MLIEPDHPQPHPHDHDHDQERHSPEGHHLSTDRVVHQLWRFLDGQVDLDLATVHRLAQTLAHSAASDKREGTDDPPDAEGTDRRAIERYPIERSAGLSYQVSDGPTPIAVTVTHKSALEVRRQLRQRDQRISDLEAVLAALLAALAHPDP